MPRFSTPILGIGIVSLGLLASGCKQKTSASSPQSLDNFASASVIRMNQCRSATAIDAQGRMNLAEVNGQPLASAVAFDATVPAAEQAALLDAFHTTLTAVPAGLQQDIAAAHGQVVLTRDVASACLGSGTGNGAAYEGCFRHSATEGGSLKVFLYASTSDIQHELLRSLAHVYVELRGPLASDVVAMGYVEDMEHTHAFDKTAMEQALAGAQASYLTSGVHGTSVRLPPHGAAWDAFSGNVFAEAIDSYFCNSWAAYDPAAAKSAATSSDAAAAFLARTDNTKRIFQDFFPNAYVAFDGVAFGTMTSSPKSASLALTDPDDPSSDQTNDSTSDQTNDSAAAQANDSAAAQTNDSAVAQTNGPATGQTNVPTSSAGASQSGQAAANGAAASNDSDSVAAWGTADQQQCTDGGGDGLMLQEGCRFNQQNASAYRPPVISAPLYRPYTADDTLEGPQAPQPLQIPSYGPSISAYTYSDAARDYSAAQGRADSAFIGTMGAVPWVFAGGALGPSGPNNFRSGSDMPTWGSVLNANANSYIANVDLMRRLEQQYPTLRPQGPQASTLGGN